MWGMESVFDTVPGLLNKIYCLSHESFEALDGLPNESTLEVNVTHEQLTDLARGGEDVVALSPTRYAEGTGTDPTAPFGKGYDIRFDTAREIVFQHKAPSNTVVRGRDNKNKRQWLQYDLDLMQIVNLAVQYNPRQAFLALPVVPTSGHLGMALDRTVFIDVWEIFARIQQKRLTTDYLLIEYLPHQNPLKRYPFDSDGAIDRKEYYATRPKIRGKYTGSKWAMHRTEPDPYYDIAYDDTLLASAVDWEPVLRAFRDADCGLPIRRLSRTDGGEVPTDDWFDLEISEQYTPQYRDHLKRKYALCRYTRSSDEALSGQIEDWLITDLDRRYHQAIEEELLSPPVTNQEAIPDAVDEKRQSVAEYIQRFQHTQDPIRYRLRQTKRYVQQAGGEAETTLLV